MPSPVKQTRTGCILRRGDRSEPVSADSGPNTHRLGTLGDGRSIVGVGDGAPGHRSGTYRQVSVDGGRRRRWDRLLIQVAKSTDFRRKCPWLVSGSRANRGSLAGYRPWSLWATAQARHQAGRIRSDDHGGRLTVALMSGGSTVQWVPAVLVRENWDCRASLCFARSGSVTSPRYPAQSKPGPDSDIRKHDVGRGLFLRVARSWPVPCGYPPPGGYPAVSTLVRCRGPARPNPGRRAM
jgi:hypothetical protein